MLVKISPNDNGSPVGKLADAEREYKASLVAEPELAEAHNNLAVVYLRLGRLEDPIFNVPTMNAVVAWPGATAQQVQDQVLNRIDARFEFDADQLITHHHDRFDFPAWSRQALGLPGWLLGWTPWLRHKVQAQAAGHLRRFLDKG